MGFGTLWEGNPVLSASRGDTGGVSALMDLPGIRNVRWAFAPILATPTRARRCLAEQLRLWGVTGPESESVLLVANELVANAVDHARTVLEVAVSFDGTAIVVEMHDESMLEPSSASLCGGPGPASRW